MRPPGASVRCSARVTGGESHKLRLPRVWCGAMFYDLNLPVDPADTRSATPSRNLRESLAMSMYHGARVEFA
jgi:hypothetical protein